MKKYTYFLLIFFILLQTSMSGDAAEEYGTDIQMQESEEIPPQSPKIDTKINITGGNDVVIIGSKLYMDIAIENLGGDYTCIARWLLNDEPVPGFTNENFQVVDGKASVFVKDMTPDYWNWGSVVIGFELVHDGDIIDKIHKEIVIKKTLFNDEEIEEVLAKIKPVRVEAKLNQTSALYQDVALKKSIGSVAYGTQVICTGSKTGFSNKISLPDGRSGWVPVWALTFANKDYTNPNDFNTLEKDIFVNGKGYESTSHYLVWINLECQKVNVFLGHKGRWKIEMVFPCSTGKNKTPTIQGVFRYYQQQRMWKYDRYYVGPVMIFSGNYAMHSVLLNYNGTVYDGTIGRPASNGCVRLLPEDIRWLVDYVPLDTTVVVH